MTVPHGLSFADAILIRRLYKQTRRSVAEYATNPFTAPSTRCCVCDGPVVTRQTRRRVTCRDCLTARKAQTSGPRVCALCGDPIVGRAGKAKFCSLRCCRNSANRARSDRIGVKRRLTPEQKRTRSCRHCGDVFVRGLKSRAVFCSDRCKYRAYNATRPGRKRQREEAA